MAEVSTGELAAAAVPRPLPQPLAVRRWLDRALPIAAVFVVLVAAWYIFAAYQNLHYLDTIRQDVNPAGWQRLSQTEKIHQALTMDRPLVPTPYATVHDLLSRLFTRPSLDTGIWADLFWTARATILGFLLGVAIGVLLALIFVSSRIMAQALLPYVVASQTVPIIALVPPILILFGLNLRSEVLISAYLAYFSITLSTYKGLQSVQPLAFELMRSYAANPWQTFFKLRLPAALPFLFTGLKIGVTASLIGAIIAELPSGAPHGLGEALLYANQQTDYTYLWSTMLAASCLGLLLYGIVVLAERLIVRWSVEETG